MISVATLFLKSKKLAFSNFSGLKSVFKKLHFHDILVFIYGRPSRRLKAVFSNISGVVWTLTVFHRVKILTQAIFVTVSMSII